jgi:hypothetical protein
MPNQPCGRGPAHLDRLAKPEPRLGAVVDRHDLEWSRWARHDHIRPVLAGKEERNDVSLDAGPEPPQREAMTFPATVAGDLKSETSVRLFQKALMLEAQPPLA